MSRNFIYKTVDGDILDEICYRYYEFTSGSVEAVLEANPHILYMGSVFSEGVEIVFPDIPRKEKKRKGVKLWD